MDKIVEGGRATQDELRGDLRALFQGAIRLTLELLLEEELKAMPGERVGRSTVSRVAKRLEGAVEGLRSEPIEGPHPYLYLDATYLDARWARKVENVSALMAYAVGPDVVVWI